MMQATLRLTLSLAAIALLSAQAQALVANDPLYDCEQTGGEWDECGSGCGPLTCDNPAHDPEMVCPAVCTPMCACPTDKPLWEEMVGCIAQADCGGGEDPAPPGMGLCKDTGGTWDWCGSGCGPMGCGDDPADFEDCPSVAVCSEWCECPADTPLWHETLGCIAEATCDVTGADGDMDGYPDDTDCDDSNAGIYPGAVEVCNDQDDNCDGVIDEGCDLQETKNLCASSGGAWTDCVSGCGPYACDRLPAEVENCVAVCGEGCQCPDNAPLWDAELGCIAETACAPGPGTGDGSGGDSGGCAGGPVSTPLLVLALLTFAAITRRRLTLEG